MNRISPIKYNFIAYLVITNLLPLMPASAQSYNTTMGLRWGDGIGASVRQRIAKKTSVEGIFYNHSKSNQTITGLMVDHHMPVLTKRLNLYVGAGFGLVYPEADEGLSTSYTAFMANAGLEFTLGRLNMSWDIVPVIPVGKVSDHSLTSLTAFSLRYVLIKKSRKGLLSDIFSKKKNNHKKHHRKSKGHAKRT